MKLSDIEAGQVYTYVRGRVSEYSTGDLVRVISTEPHTFDRRTGAPVLAPGYKVGEKTALGRRVGILIASIASGQSANLADPKWDDLTVETAKASDEISLDIVRQQELHPAEFKAELELRYKERIASRRREDEALAQRRNRREAAGQTILDETGARLEVAIAIGGETLVGALEAVAKTLTERTAQVRAVEALADSMERESPDGVGRLLAAQLRATLAKAAGAKDKG